MKRLGPITTIFLLVAALLSLGLTVSAFLVHIPVRAGSQNLVRTASGAYKEAPVVPQTYFQRYGVAEVLLVGLGLILTIAVLIALRQRSAQGGASAGAVAWGLSIGCLLLGIVGSVTVAPYMLIVGVLLVLACSTFSRNGAATRRAKPGARVMTSTIR